MPLLSRAALRARFDILLERRARHATRRAMMADARLRVTRIALTMMSKSSALRAICRMSAPLFYTRCRATRCRGVQR